MLDVGSEKVAPECRCLLEIPAEDLINVSLEDQTLWLCAVQAGQDVQECTLRVSEGQVYSWDKVIRDGRFTNVPVANAVLEGHEEELVPPLAPKAGKKEQHPVKSTKRRKGPAGCRVVTPLSALARA